MSSFAQAANVAYQQFAVIGQRSGIPKNLLERWSELSAAEPHMLTVSADELDATLYHAVLAWDGRRPVGFAGIFPARTRDGHPVCYQEVRVMEFGSAVVEPEYRGHYIGQRMMRMRQTFLAGGPRAAIGVCVSTNPVVHHLLRKTDWYITDDTGLRHELCLCQNDRHNGTCPLQPDACWLFIPAGK